MITAWLLNLPAQLLNAVIGLLPAGSPVPTEWISAVYSAWGYVNAFSFIVPVSTLLVCVGIAISIEMAVLSFKFFHWIVTKIPFIG